MDIKELFSRGASLNLEPVEDIEASDIQPGDNAIGYRVMFDVEIDGQHYYHSPLVNRNPKKSFYDLYSYTSARIYQSNYNAETLQDSDDMLVGSGVHKADPNRTRGDDNAGFYYFKSKEAAEDYMMQIALGIQTAGNAEAPLNDESLLYNPERKVRLGLFQVSGVEQKKPWDEGSLMDEMTINPEPVTSLEPSTVSGFKHLVTSTTETPPTPELQKAMEFWKDFYSQS